MIWSTYLLLSGLVSIYANEVELNSELVEFKHRYEEMLPSKCKVGYGEFKTKEGRLKLKAQGFKIMNTCNVSKSIYNKSEIIAKCENFIYADFISDSSLFTPVTSIKKNITYWNQYCAICNLETELSLFESWNVWLACKSNGSEEDDNEDESEDENEPENGAENTTETEIDMKTNQPFVKNAFSGKLNGSEEDDNEDESEDENEAENTTETEINTKTEAKDKNEDKVEDKDENKNKDNFNRIFNLDSLYKCKIVRVLPNRLKAHVRNCSYPGSRTDSHVKAFQGKVVNLLNYSIARHPIGFLNIASQNAAGLDSNLSSLESLCDYSNKYLGKCSTNKFYNTLSDGSTCNENGYFIKKSMEFDRSGWNECSNHTSKQNTIYVCGPTKSEFYNKVKKYIIRGMDYVSIFLLIVYLAISTNKQNLRKLPQRIFYSYSLTLLALYVNEYTFPYVELCLIRYYVFFYIWQSHSFWILIVSYDLWRIVYSSSKLRKIEVEDQTQRYLVYCLICWGLPGIFLATLFPTLNNDQKSWYCPVVSGFQNEMLCSSNHQLNEYSDYIEWITMAIFLAIAPCLLILTCLLICLNSRNARSNANDSYVLTNLKVALMMGVHWTLLVYVVAFNSTERFSIIYQFISALHGTFIFFAFGMKKKKWNNLKDSLNERFISKFRNTSSTQPAQEIPLGVKFKKFSNKSYRSRS